MELGLHSVLVFAPDLEMARHFYGSVLGLRENILNDDHVSFEGHGFELTVLRCESSAEYENYAAVAGSSIAFSVKSLDMVVSELRSQGVRFLHSEPQDGPLGRYVAFVDPFGTVHELLEHPGTA